VCAADPEVVAVMRVVRYFGDGPEDAPLGWHLSPVVLRFLIEIRAGLDVDEYDMHRDTRRAAPRQQDGPSTSS